MPSTLFIRFYTPCPQYIREEIPHCGNRYRYYLGDDIIYSRNIQSKVVHAQVDTPTNLANQIEFDASHQEGLQARSTAVVERPEFIKQKISQNRYLVAWYLSPDFMHANDFNKKSQQSNINAEPTGSHTKEFGKTYYPPTVTRQR